MRMESKNEDVVSRRGEKVRLKTKNLLLPCQIQGTSKITFPGSVNKTLNNCVFLPAVGKQTQLFHTILTEPGKVILEVPCSPQTPYVQDWTRRLFPG